MKVHFLGEVIRKQHSPLDELPTKQVAHTWVDVIADALGAASVNVTLRLFHVPRDVERLKTLVLPHCESQHCGRNLIRRIPDGYIRTDLINHE